MVPTMIGLCFASEGYHPERFASLQRLVYGASPMPEAILDRLRADLPDLQLIQGYGMTEACSTVTLLLNEDHQPGSPRIRSVGKPALGIRVSILDDDGNILPRGEIGEVCVRGGQLMREHWNKPDATAEVFRGGWHHTGDAGYLDEDCYKVPKSVDFRDDPLPLSGAMKILKRDLRAPYWKDREKSIG